MSEYQTKNWNSLDFPKYANQNYFFILFCPSIWQLYVDGATQRERERERERQRQRENMTIIKVIFTFILMSDRVSYM